MFMPVFLYSKRLRLVPAYGRNLECCISNLGILLGNAQFIVTRPFSFVEAAEGSDKQKREGQRHLFTVSYLVNSCGLSLESAKSRYKHVKLSTPEKPDSVIRLLKKHGFSDEQITKVVKSFPRVLVSAHSTLLPKLEFFCSIGLSSSDRAKFISSCPKLLDRSLNSSLIPCHDFLKRLLVQDESIVKCLKRSSWVLLEDVQKSLVPKVSVFRSQGVLEAHIRVLFTRCPRILSGETKRVYEIVKKVINLGFDHSKMNFIQAFIAIFQMQKSTWERKKEVYKRWGWSEDDVSSAFKKYPICMTLSEKKIAGGMDFLVNKMGLQPSDIAKYPVVLGLSLEKRIIPRCLVIKILLSVGILKKKDVNYPCILIRTEKMFMDRFVIKYQKDFPQLLSVVQGKIGLEDLGSCEEGPCVWRKESQVFGDYNSAV